MSTLAVCSFIALAMIAAAIMLHEHRAMRARHRRIREALAAWSQLDAALSRALFDAIRADQRGDVVAAQARLDTYDRQRTQVDAAWAIYKRLTGRTS